jgi:hypothetical protein
MTGPSRRALISGVAALALASAFVESAQAGQAVRGVVLGRSPWTPARLMANGALAGWYDQARLSLASTKVAEAYGYAGSPSLLQGTDALRPTFSTDKLVFNNTTSTFMAMQGARAFSATLAQASALTLPDGASGSAPGKGYTCTGAARDPRDNTLWGGNYGKPSEATAPSATFASSVVQLTPDGHDFIREITLAYLGITQNTTVGGVQATVWDPTDNTLWAAVPELDRVYHIDVSGSGTLLGSIPFTGANGLAIDLGTNELIVCPAGSNPNASWISKSTGAVSKARGLTGTAVDHLYYDNTRAWLLYSAGNNGADGTVSILDVGQSYIRATYTLTGANAIEGFLLNGDELLVFNDGKYHDQPQQLNQLLRYVLNPAPPAITALGSRILLFGIARIPAALTGTHCLMSMGEPLSTTKPGIGLFFPANNTSALRLFTDNVFVDFATTTTTRFMYVIDVDLAAKTAACWINGISLGAPAAMSAVARTTLPALPLVVGANIESNILARYTNSEVTAIGVATGNYAVAHRQEVEGVVDWDAILTALLPANHPYKTRRP